jgi:predicted metal-dependent HD superfamily phosphohydrolase
MEQELRDRWAAVVGLGRAQSAALQSLLARYREPHRRYHGLAHLLRVLRTIDELVATVAVADAGAVRLAAWYHDAVYDPASPGNEAASARLAERSLGSVGLEAGRVKAVSRLVLATAGHEPSDTDEAILVDADLAVLAADPATYSAYARGVRREYGHLDDDTWQAGRAEVLRSFLARATIFTTPPMLAREALARANLAAELAGLTGLTGVAGVAAPPGSTSVGAVGGASDAPDTVVDALARLRELGYTAEAEVQGQSLRCGGCGTEAELTGLVADHVYRFEGMSNPDDEAIVIGVTCPACEAKGVLVSAYGPAADPEELAGVRMVAERYAG